MNGPLMKQLKSLPIWTILGIGLLTVAGVVLVVAFFGSGTATTAPERTAVLSPVATENSPMATLDTVTREPDPTSEPDATSEPDSTSGTAPMSEGVAAMVNGYTITQAYLSQTVRLNTVLGELSGAQTYDERETLQRLVSSQLILQGVPITDEPKQEDVEGFISALEGSWGVTQETVDQELQAVGLDRAFLEDTISRLLTVQAGVEVLEEQGQNVTEWLREQEEDAQIMISEDLASAEEAEATPPEVPAVASNFTLDRAGGGSFELEEQLKDGPVVLVFFEKCG